MEENLENTMINLFQKIQDWRRGVPLGAGRSSFWAGTRKAHLIASPNCAVCGGNKKIEVHHIQPFNINHELELVKENLITLCEPHHFLMGHLNSWRSWNENVAEDSRIWLEKIKNRP